MKKIIINKWEKELFIIDVLISLIVLILIDTIRMDLVMIVAFFFIFPYLILSKRTLAILHLSVAISISLIWNLIAQDYYGYNLNMISIFGINLYPLFAWSLGLFGVYLIFSHIEHKLINQNFLMKFSLFILIFWTLLISVETIAYHIFDLRNLVTSNYIGLPICNCIHAPFWMQLSYLLMGPIYFILCEIFKLKNPNIIKNEI